jgi:hypothetical protein
VGGYEVVVVDADATHARVYTVLLHSRGDRGWGHGMRTGDADGGCGQGGAYRNGVGAGRVEGGEDGWGGGCAVAGMRGVLLWYGGDGGGGGGDADLG